MNLFRKLKRRPRRIFRVALPLVVAAASVMILVLPAQAVNSGYLLQEQIQEYSGEVNFCGEAALLATANFRSLALSNTYNNPCSLTSNTWSSPAGYLGVNAYGEFNGSYCGQTGWAYNASSTYNFGVGEVMCSGKGCGVFTTAAGQAFWNYYADEYYGGYETSPSQNYCT